MAKKLSYESDDGKHKIQDYAAYKYTTPQCNSL